MRFLLDQDVYAATARHLRHLGHDVLTASDARLSEAEDIQLLAAAAQEQRILVTRDRDYGTRVFHRKAGEGVIYLRVSPLTLEEVHTELTEVLRSHSEDSLRKAFVTVEPGRHRFRRILR